MKKKEIALNLYNINFSSSNRNKTKSCEIHLNPIEANKQINLKVFICRYGEMFSDTLLSQNLCFTIFSTVTVVLEVKTFGFNIFNYLLIPDISTKCLKFNIFYL